MKEYFVGFGSAAEWKSAINQERQVNVAVITEIGPTNKMGLASGTSYLVLSQLRDDEVLYLLVPVTRFQAMGGRPFEREVDQHARRGETAQAIAVAWLDRAGIPHRTAVMATPRNLKLMEGTAEFLHYDKEADSYVMAGVPAQA